MNVRHILYHWASSASNLPSFFNEKSLCVCAFLRVRQAWTLHGMYAEIREQACVLAFTFTCLFQGFLFIPACGRIAGPVIFQNDISFCLPSHHRSAWMTDAGFMWILGIWAQVFRLARSTFFTETSLPPGYGFSFNISVKSTYIIMCKVIQHITIKKSLQCLEAASATCAQFK